MRLLIMSGSGSLPIAGFKAIADPFFSHNVANGAIFRLKLIAKVIHEHVQILWLLGAGSTPHRRKQRLVSNHPGQNRSGARELDPTTVRIEECFAGLFQNRGSRIQLDADAVIDGLVRVV